MEARHLGEGGAQFTAALLVDLVEEGLVVPRGDPHLEWDTRRVGAEGDQPFAHPEDPLVVAELMFEQDAEAAAGGAGVVLHRTLYPGLDTGWHDRRREDLAVGVAQGGPRHQALVAEHEHMAQAAVPLQIGDTLPPDLHDLGDAGGALLREAGAMRRALDDDFVGTETIAALIWAVAPRALGPFHTQRRVPVGHDPLAPAARAGDLPDRRRCVPFVPRAERAEVFRDLRQGRVGKGRLRPAGTLVGEDREAAEDRILTDFGHRSSVEARGAWRVAADLLANERIDSVDSTKGGCWDSHMKTPTILFALGALVLGVTADSSVESGISPAQIDDGTLMIYDPANPCNRADTTNCYDSGSGKPKETWPIGVIGVKADATHPDEVWVFVNLPSGKAWPASTAVNYFSDNGTPTTYTDDVLKINDNVHGGASSATRWKHPGMADTSSSVNSELVFHKQDGGLLKGDGTAFGATWTEQNFCNEWQAKLSSIWSVTENDVGCFKNPQKSQRQPSWEQ